MEFADSLIAWWTNHLMLGSLLIMMILDIVLGLIRAGQDKKLSSDISGRGMRRKSVMLILVLVGAVLGRAAGASGVGEAIAAFFMVSELLSIVENAGLLGVPIPPPLAAILVQLRASTGNDAPAFRLGDSPRDHPVILQARELGTTAHDKDQLRPDPAAEAIERIEEGDPT